MSRELTPNNNSCSQDHSVLKDDESSSTRRNNSYSYRKLGDLIPGGNKNSNLRLWFAIVTVILIVLMGCSVFYLMSSIEENHSALQTKNESFHHTSVINYTNGNYKNTTRNPLFDLDICLKNIEHPFEGIHGTEKCIERPVVEKSLVFLVEIDSLVSNCLISFDEESCSKQLSNFKQRYINLGFSHTFYNFFIGAHGTLYEGRPLTCPIKENDKDWDYVKDQILIGIPHCDKLSSSKTQEKSQFNFSLKNLLACLEKEGLFSKGYVILIPRYCKHYFDYPILGDYEKKIRTYP